MVDWYISSCLNTAYTNEDLKNEMLRKDAACYGPPPRSSETNTEEHTSVYYFDGKTCRATYTDLTFALEITPNIFESYDHCQLACISPCYREQNVTAVPQPEVETNPTSPDVDKYAFDSREGCILLDSRTLNKDIFMDKSDCAFLCLESYVNEEELIIFRPSKM